MSNLSFEDLASAIASDAEACQAQLVELKRNTADLRPLLDADDSHGWVHIAHSTQVVGCASALARLLRVADETEPLVFAALVRPAWEASLQLDWIHTDTKKLSLRWFDYAYFKAVLELRGGTNRLVQEDVLFQLSGIGGFDPDYDLLRRLCSRHMTRQEVEEATSAIAVLLAGRHDDHPWHEMSDEEWDALNTESEARERHITTLQPLRSFLRAVRRATGWNYPHSWTTTKVSEMVRDLYVASPSPYSTTATDYPTWPYVWDPDGHQQTSKYRDYRRLSEVLHAAGPGALHTFGKAWSQYRASAQFIRSAAELMLDVLQTTRRAYWECTDQV